MSEIFSVTTDNTYDDSQLLSLVYISASSHLLGNAELEAILKKSRENNTRLGLTGLLLYYDGAFMQVLEGPEATVRTLYTRINRDPRHSRITRLLEERIEERAFPDWSMGYYRLKADDLHPIAGFTTFAEADQFLNYFEETPQKSVILLQSFRKSTKR